MAIRHPWFSQNLKRKHPDDLGPDGSSGGVGVGGMMYGGIDTNAYGVEQVSPPNQDSNSNERATKRVRKFESRNLERGFAELSIQPTPASSPPHIQQQQQQQQQDTQVGGDGVWSNVVGDVGEGSSVVCPDGSTLPLLRSSSVDEPPSPDVDDIQMSTSTWYEPEKDSESLVALSPPFTRRILRFAITGIIITSLDDEEYDGDDEGQQKQSTGANSIAQGSEFTISPAFLKAINKKLTRAVDPPPPADTSTSQALILFRPMPTIALPPAEGDLEGPPSHINSEGWMLDCSPKPPPPSPSLSSPFHAQDFGRPSFVFNDDDMEIEML